MPVTVMKGGATTYRRPSLSLGQGLDGVDFQHLRKANPNGTGFFFVFKLPFRREDVFAELLSERGELGSDGSGIQTRILRPGREMGKPVRRRSPRAIAPRCSLTSPRPPGLLADIERLHS